MGEPDDDADDDEPMELFPGTAHLKRRDRRDPRHFAWHSPVGIFEVLEWYFDDGKPPWGLWLNAKELGRFKDHIDAMLAVIRKKTGDVKWDWHVGPEQPPENERDWRDSGHFP